MITIPRGFFWLLYLVGLVACFAAAAAVGLLLAVLPDWQVYTVGGTVAAVVFGGAVWVCR